MKNYKNLVFVLVTVLAILIQLTNSTQAYADDGAPTQPADPATEVTPPQDPVATEPPSQPVTSTAEAVTTELATEAAPTELPVAPTLDVASDPSAVIPVTDEPTVSEIVQQISADTGIVVVDETGAVVPLATQEAAEIIVSSDPIWCPAGQKPGDAGCSISYASLNDLLTDIGTTINSDGTIWITSGVVADTNPILINGSIYTNWASYALTLQGGWSGISGDTTIGPNSIFSVPISILNWNNNVAINNLTIDGATIGDGGLLVSTNGNINLNNITSENNSGVGVLLDNTNGFGAVTISGTNNFNNNYYDGLVVLSNGNINLNNVTASGNTYGDGAYLNSNDSIANVVLTGTNVFNGNGNSGLYVQYHGNVALNNVTASGNGYKGVFLEGWNVSGDVNLTGTNVFNNNQNDGLTVFNNGTITLNNITANGNLKGVWIQQYDTTKSVTLTGVNTFNDNFSPYYPNEGIGLTVFSYGPIILNNITASGNRRGANLDNTGIGTGAVDVTLNGANVFNNNLTDGLIVSSRGNVMLNGVTANYNGASGIYLFTPGDAIINTSTLINNGAFGVDASSVCGNFSLNEVDFGYTDAEHTYQLPASGYHFYTNLFTGSTIIINCNPKVYIDGVLVYGGTLETSGSQLEFTLDCENQSLYNVTLPNDDRVQIFCPVSGKALIKRLDNTMLPAYLPAGYTYASAFSLDIFQGQGTIPVITEGGNIKASFHLPSLEVGTSYSILYWDNGTWIPLKEFMLDENGNPRSFELSPGDPRVILSGLNFDFSGASPRVEVSTNFPGVFVLAQH